MHLTTTTKISLFSIIVIFDATAIVLNVSGLALLLSIGRDLSSQHTILLYFTAIRLISCTTMATEVAIFAVNNTTCTTLLCSSVEIFNSFTLRWVCKLMLLVITVNRTLAIVIGLRYHAAARPSCVHAVMVGCLLLGALGSFPLYLIDFEQHRTTVNGFVLVSDAGYIGIAASTFYKIFSYVKRSNQASGRMHPWKRQTFIMPALILISFVFFEGASDVIAFVQPNDLMFLLARNLIHTCSFLSDAVIYTILQPRVKHQLLYYMGRRRHSSLSNVNALEALRMRGEEMLKHRRSTVVTLLDQDQDKQDEQKDTVCVGRCLLERSRAIHL